MSVERSIMAFAGFMVLLSLVLTATVSPHFVWLTVFVGANLFQSAFTGFCPAATNVAAETSNSRFNPAPIPQNNNP
ncbi:MAG TPA: DUF2892 domain-containing protein [Shewanella frigidimarina]|nr:DUF2892 domain-containing protein [Shewanella frigidimarina]